MADYILIESRDPFDSGDVDYLYNLASGLAENGDKVTVFLVQNGVLPAREGTRVSELSALAKTGVEILADDFSLSERGIDPGRLVEGVHAAPLETVVDQLADGRKAIWH